MKVDLCDCGNYKNAAYIRCETCKELSLASVWARKSSAEIEASLNEEPLIAVDVYDWDYMKKRNDEFIKAAEELSPKGLEDLEKPKRYNIGKIEVWDFILDQGMGFLEGNCIKYLCRFRQKNGIEDLKKARVYLDKLIAEEENK